jgi:hypothetical protein
MFRKALLRMAVAAVLAITLGVGIVALPKPARAATTSASIPVKPMLPEGIGSVPCGPINSGSQEGVQIWYYPTSTHEVEQCYEAFGFYLNIPGGPLSNAVEICNDEGIGPSGTAPEIYGLGWYDSARNVSVIGSNGWGCSSLGEPWNGKYITGLTSIYFDGL